MNFLDNFKTIWKRYTTIIVVYLTPDWFLYVKQLPQIMENFNMKLAELTATLNSINENLVKAQTEILGRIENLEAALTDVSIPAEAEEALAALRTTATNLDDIVPDVEL